MARKPARKSPPVIKVTAPEFVTPKAASQLFGPSPWSMRHLVRLGLVDAKRYGERRVLLSYRSLQRYFNGLPAARP